MKIRATIDAYKVDIDHLPQNGLVVALLVQHRRYGKFQEYKYSLPAGPDTAYFVVEPGTPYNGINTGKWTLVTASSTFSGDISRGTFYRCDTDDDAPTASYATFGTCLSDHIAARKAFAVFRESQRAATDSLAAKALRAAIVSAGEYDDPAWLSCVHGCCIADQGAPQLQGRTSRKR